MTRKEACILLVCVSVRTERIARFFRDIQSRATGEPVPWLFLGRDYQMALSWEGGLGIGFRRLEIGRSLEEAADQLREHFVTWVDDLGRRYGEDPDWWLTRISERNTLISPLFLYVCYLAVARKYLSSSKRPMLIVAESWGLVESLRMLSAAAGVKSIVLSTWRKWITLAERLMRILLVWGCFALRSWRRRRAARVTLARASLPDFSASSQSGVLVDTFFRESNLSQDGVFRDSCFPYLHEWLATRGFQVWVLPTFTYLRSSTVDVYRWIRSCSAHILIPEDWLKPSDYVAAFRCSIKGLFYPRTTAPIDGLNVERLVNEERWKQAASRRPMEACLLGRVPLRLREVGFVPSLIVNWFENQIVDKALVIGCNRAFPGVTHTGFQNTPLFPNLLNLFPTAVECQAKVIPNRVVCSGPLHRDILLSQSQGQVQAVVGCGLRYAYLWNQHNHARKRNYSQGKMIVLVALPDPLPGAIEIIDLLLPIFSERQDAIWYVKLHPNYSLQALRQALRGRKTNGIEYVDGSLQEWINKSSVVITAGSGAALEAAASGVPVIVVGSRTALNYDPLAWFDGRVGIRCCSSEEIGQKLDELSMMSESAYETLQQNAQEVLHACFSRVTDDALRQILA